MLFRSIKKNKKIKIHFIGIGGIGMSGIAELMNNLSLDNPKMIDIAVPANIKGKTLG